MERPEGGSGVEARSAPQWGDRPPHARPAPRRAPGLREWKIGRLREGPAAAAAAPVGGQPGDLLEGDPG